MKSPSLSSDKLQCMKKERWFNMDKLSPFFLSSLVITSIIIFFILYSPNPFDDVVSKHDPDHQRNVSFQFQKDDENCDLFKGHWVPDMNGSLYTNWSCSTIPDSKNCMKNGRKDGDFVNWRWKPEDCELPRFDPNAFLQIVKGKKMAFIGDSVARNHMESLLCLLSTEEIPIDISKDSEDRFRTWHFPRHNFTLMVFWSQFLVTGTERVINGSNSGIFDLQLDTIDHRWTHKLPGLDFAILSSGHWFFRKLYLFRGTNVAGCVYCNDRDITNLGLSFALRMSFRAALEQINQCQECRRLVTLVRTFSPTHFENGTWDTGGSCQRTGPSDEDKIFQVGGLELELRRIQMEEMERARKRGKKGGKWFEALDITMAMLVRGDGHPGSHWGNKWMKGYNDCTHWCLPGPIDVWNDLLMAMLRKKALLFG